MKIGIVIYSNDTETVCNALHFVNFSLKCGDDGKTMKDLYEIVKECDKIVTF